MTDARHAEGRAARPVLGHDIQPHGTLVWVDADRRIEGIAENARSWFGCDASAALGRRLHDVSPTLADAIDRFDAGRPDRRIARFTFDLGSPGVALGRFHPLGAGGLVELERVDAGAGHVSPFAWEGLEAFDREPTAAEGTEAFCAHLASAMGIDFVEVGRVTESGRVVRVASSDRDRTDPTLAGGPSMRGPASRAVRDTCAAPVGVRISERRLEEAALDGGRPFGPEELPRMALWAPDPATAHAFALRGFRALFATPIACGGRLDGWIVCGHRSPRAWPFELFRELELAAAGLGSRIDVPFAWAVDDAHADETSLLRETQSLADVGGFAWYPATGRARSTIETTRLLDLDADVPFTLEHLLDRFDGTDREMLDECVRLAVEDGLPWDLELRTRRRDGSAAWVRVKAEPRRAADGSSRIVGLVQDVGERKRYEEELRRYLDEVEVARDRIQSRTAELARQGEEPLAAKRQAESATRC